MFNQTWLCPLVLLPTLITATLWAETNERFASVSGIGKVTAPPDMATINTGVVSEAADANEALKMNNLAVEQLMFTLSQAGIAEKDIQTSNFNVSPKYEHTERGKKRRAELIGYTVSNQLFVRVRKVNQLGKILDSLVKAGSNQLSGISFGIADTDNLMDLARIAAIKDAQHRAELYATTAGVKLGKVVSIVEQSSYAPVPRSRKLSMLSMEAADKVPIATGEHELSVSVQAHFELED